VAGDERDGELHERQPGLVGEGAERVGGVELRRVGGQRGIERGGEALLAAALPGPATSRPLRYLPESQPPASGLYVSTPMP
jgi:hypothetical protein